MGKFHVFRRHRRNWIAIIWPIVFLGIAAFCGLVAAGMNK